MKIGTIKAASDVDVLRFRTAVGNRKRQMDACFVAQEFFPPSHEFVDVLVKFGADGLVTGIEKFGG